LQVHIVIVIASYCYSEQVTVCWRSTSDCHSQYMRQLSLSTVVYFQYVQVLTAITNHAAASHPVLSPVLFIPSLYYAFLFRRIFI